MNASFPLAEEHNHRKWSYWLLAIGCALLVLTFVIGINDNPPGAVSMLAGLFAVILGIVYRVGMWGKRKPAQQLLYWTPRGLCIAFAMAISLFALDVFGEGRGFWTTILALLMHLIPTAILLIVLALSWRWEWVGGVLFTALGVLYLVMFWGKFALSVYLLISGPLFLVGILFLMNWVSRASLRANA
jgi:hypothetical protein